MAVNVKGGGAEEASAVERAAALLARARLPVIGGLLTDIAGAEAALALAEQLGGVIDHAAGEGLSRASLIMREAGGCPASFGEVRNRADVIVLVGEAPLKREPGLLDTLFHKEEGLPRPGDRPRELVLLGCDQANVPANIPVTTLELGDLDLATLADRLSGALHQHGTRTTDGDVATKLESIAERLHQGAFPVFVISPCDLNEPILHTILAMVRHLCLTTRAATLSLAAPGNGDGVNLCSVWTCGLPVRTSFASGLPEHDPWRYGARRLIESGEADALLWVDALLTSGIEQPRGVPTVLLSASGDAKVAAGDVLIKVGSPGRDHDGELYLSKLAGIGMVKASEPNAGAPTVAEVLAGIAKRVGSREARA
jgi:formylmethanofuran dehydrogenase subunit B